MSTLPENELDLEKLLLPAWAQEPASAKNYEHYQGGEERQDRRGERHGRRPGLSRDGGASDRPRDQRPRQDRGGSFRREGGEKKNFDRNRSGFRRDESRAPRPAPTPPPDVNLSLLPEERGVESLARQIKTTARAYPLFDIARLVLERPERFVAEFRVRKNPEGQIIQPLFVCLLDDTLWLTEDEAVAHVLKNHFATFYQTERTATEPPKGKYTFVAQCGMSGAILGPPNHHDYQNQLRKLHAERFSRMPFDAFKARVKIVRDEEVVKKWIDDQSWKTEYICLNMPEPLRSWRSRDEVEKHFRETHKDNIIKRSSRTTLSGAAARALRSSGPVPLVRQTWEDQKRFPLQTRHRAEPAIRRARTAILQGQQDHHARFGRAPAFLDLETTPVSEGVKRIVEYINAHAQMHAAEIDGGARANDRPAPRYGNLLRRRRKQSRRRSPHQTNPPPSRPPSSPICTG